MTPMSRVDRRRPFADAAAATVADDDAADDDAAADADNPRILLPLIDIWYW